MNIIAITGGIGSGKTVISHILSVMGYPVYDCDSRAITLIHCDQALRASICELLGPEAYDAMGHYDRKWVSKKVFSCPQLLRSLNRLVHPAVIADMRQWAFHQTSDLVFVETALLRQGGVEPHVDGIWRVMAPEQLRIKRVERRSGLSRASIARRIAAQHSQEAPFDNEQIIYNDGNHSVLEQLHRLLDITKMNNTLNI